MLLRHRSSKKRSREGYQVAVATEGFAIARRGVTQLQQESLQELKTANFDRLWFSEKMSSSESELFWRMIQ
jgi:hypothetical protein